MLSVALFGHRKLEDVTKVEDILTRVVEGLLAKYAYVDFYMGRNGEFDEVAASLIKRLRKRYGSERCGLILVLPYPVKDAVYYETYYDSILVPQELTRVHCKNAITLRNRWMVDNTDLTAVYAEHSSGGAYAAFRYAMRKQHCTVDLANMSVEY